MQKQTQLQQLPKLIMAVTLVVMLGALFGAVGYFIANPPWVSIPIINTPEVTITTDKTEYEQGDIIEIQLENNLAESLFLTGCNEYSLEKKENGQWKKEPPLKKCKWEGQAVKINPNEKENFILNANKPGIFRIAVEYFQGCQENKPISQADCKIKTTNYSPEFTIKKKIAIDPRCSEKVEFDRLCASNSFFRGYEFDSGEGKCIEKQEMACPFTSKTPFNSLEECQNTCEKSNEKKLEFETIEKKSYSGNLEQKNYVIKNSKDWNDLWSKMDNTRDVPIVFNRDMIIAVFQGKKSTGGYSIEINRITEKENEIEVSVLETSSGSGCMVTKMLTSPYHIIKLAKQTKEIKFNVTRMTNNCESYSQ